MHGHPLYDLDTLQKGSCQKDSEPWLGALSPISQHN